MGACPPPPCPRHLPPPSPPSAPPRPSGWPGVARDHAAGAQRRGCPPRPGRRCGSSARTCRSGARTSCAAPTTCSPSSTRPSGRPGRCARAPATTARAWPTPAGCSGCAGACTSRAPPRGRSGSGSRRWAATPSSWSSTATATTTPRRPRAEHAARTGATLVPAFDDRRTVAGQGTVGVEILDQLGRPPDLVVVPVGGGGLLAGVGMLLRARHPETRVVGVEPAGRGEHDRGPAGRRAGDAARARLVRRRRGGAPGRRGDAADGAGEPRGGADRARGAGVHRDARPLPGRRDHRRARGRAGLGGAGRGGGRRARARRWCACCPGATTT